MRSVFGNHSNNIRNYLLKFIQNSNEILKNIESAIQKQNTESAMNYFHQLKGPVGSSGFKKMYQLCERAEEKITEMDWVCAQKSCHEISEMLVKLKIELDKKFKS